MLAGSENNARTSYKAAVRHGEHGLAFLTCAWDVSSQPIAAGPKREVAAKAGAKQTSKRRVHVQRQKLDGPRSDVAPGLASVWPERHGCHACCGCSCVDGAERRALKYPSSSFSQQRQILRRRQRRSRGAVVQLARGAGGYLQSLCAARQV